VGEKWVADDCSYLCKGLFVLFYPINDMFINFFEIMTEVGNSLGKIYFFTNIRHLKGDKITHRWSYKGKVKA
jgi:hypothetical protein